MGLNSPVVDISAEIVDPARALAHPTKRTAFDTLKKARLVEIASGFELGVAQKMPKAEFVEALAGSHKSSFEKVLALLSRDELKEICRAHDLDDKGKKKRKPVTNDLLHRAREGV